MDEEGFGEFVCSYLKNSRLSWLFMVGYWMNRVIEWVFLLVLVFTLFAFGAMDLWALTFMELGILVIVVLWVFSHLRSGYFFRECFDGSWFVILLLFSFLLFILFQMIPLPSGVIRVLSPKAYELRSFLVGGAGFFPISFYPLLTRVEFLKWFSLSVLFLILVCGRVFGSGGWRRLVVVIFLLGVFESSYGMYEFFNSGGFVAVKGTFVNPNAFAGFLLIVIPLSVGYFFSRRSMGEGVVGGLRGRLVNLDGRDLLLGFGILLMMLGLIFSYSRMGVGSLFLSFIFMLCIFRKSFWGSRVWVFLFLFLVGFWAGWIGLNSVVDHFLRVGEDFWLRFRIWGDVFSIFRDFPFFGTGLGTFVSVYPVYRSFHVEGLVTHAENDFLQLISEVGLVGFGLVGVLFFYLIVIGVRRVRVLWSSERFLGVGVLVGVFALIFYSLFERGLGVTSNAFLFVFLLGLLFRGW